MGGDGAELLVKVVVLERIMKAGLFVAAHKVTIIEAIDAVVRQGVLGDRRAPWFQAHPAFGRDAEAGNCGRAVAVFPGDQLDATLVFGPNVKEMFEISKRESESSTLCGVDNTRRCRWSV